MATGKLNNIQQRQSVETLFDSQSYKIKYDRKNKIFFTFWSNIELLSDESYKENLLKYIELVLEHKPEKVLIDLSKGFYPTNIQIELWAEKNVYKKMENSGVKKIAFLLPDKPLHSIEVQNIIAWANSKSKVKRKTFFTKEEAINWLNS